MNTHAVAIEVVRIRLFLPGKASSLTSLLLLLGSALPLAAQDVSEVDTHRGCVHMPVIHSTNTRVFEKRAVEVMLANRSDVAYYAQRN